MQYSSGEIVKHLGKGVYGSVDLVKFTKSDGSSFHSAVKTSVGDLYDYLYKEFRILSELSGSTNIVQCFSDDLEEDRNSKGERVFKLLLEHASEGSLKAFMDNYTDRKLPEPIIRDFTRMILQGLVSIHDHEYVHCDLKSDNLLVFLRGDSSYELKIADFGNTIEVGNIPEHWAIDYPFVGTANYMPPESFRTGRAEETLDIWSLGCLVLEMYTGKGPWPGVNAKDVESLLLDGKAPEIPETVPCDAREFIETCFARNPKDRGSASELLFHWFLRRCREEDKTEEKIIAVSVDAEDLVPFLFDGNAPEILESVPCEEKKEKDIIAVSGAEETRNSWLLKLKLKLRIIRASKKSMDPPKKPLKSKMLSSKYLPFKKFLNKFLRLKL